MSSDKFSISVSNLEWFRVWRADEDMDLPLLLNRLLGKEAPSEAMKTGTAFHEALEAVQEGELGVLATGDYRFDFNCDCEVEIPVLTELSVEKQYGDLLVRGRVDGVSGKAVIDYKTTSQFDADRLMVGYQWRFYLDMLGADKFQWQVFVLNEFGPEKCYEVRQVHTLYQNRYPGLHEDCAKLAREYLGFAQEHLVGLTPVREPAIALRSS